MTDTAQTVSAAQRAESALHGLLRADGIPYIFCAAHSVAALTDESRVTAALLHAAAADTAVMPGALAAKIPARVMAALRLLTHAHGENDITRLRESPDARAVKLTRRQAKYSPALSILTADQ